MAWWIWPSSLFPQETFSSRLCSIDISGAAYLRMDLYPQHDPARRLNRDSRRMGDTWLPLPRTQQLLLNAVDRLGRPIEPCVLSVAQEMAPQALAYAENFIGDPCVAMNLLEEAAATVSEAVRAKETARIPPIRDMRAYLYRAFLRRIGEEERSEARLQEALEDDLRLGETMSIEARVETKLVLKQILSMCDRKTRAIIWGRIEGRSWDEISYDVVMSNHAARLHYSKALRAIRDALKTDPQQYIEGIKLS